MTKLRTDSRRFILFHCNIIKMYLCKQYHVWLKGSREISFLIVQGLALSVAMFICSLILYSYLWQGVLDHGSVLCHQYYALQCSQVQFSELLRYSVMYMYVVYYPVSILLHWMAECMYSVYTI